MTEQASITPFAAENLAATAKKSGMAITDPRVATRVYQQYLGTLTLLGHAISRNGRLDEFQISRVFKDANNILKATGSDVRYRRSSNGGFGAFIETPDAAP